MKAGRIRRKSAPAGRPLRGASEHDCAYTPGVPSISPGLCPGCTWVRRLHHNAWPRRPCRRATRAEPGANGRSAQPIRTIAFSEPECPPPDRSPTPTPGRRRQRCRRDGRITSQNPRPPPPVPIPPPPTFPFVWAPIRPAVLWPIIDPPTPATSRAHSTMLWRWRGNILAVVFVWIRGRLLPGGAGETEALGPDQVAKGRPAPTGSGGERRWAGVSRRRGGPMAARVKAGRFRGVGLSRTTSRATGVGRGDGATRRSWPPTTGAPGTDGRPAATVSTRGRRRSASADRRRHRGQPWWRRRGAPAARGQQEQVERPRLHGRRCPVGGDRFRRRECQGRVAGAVVGRRASVNAVKLGLPMNVITPGR